MNLIDTIRADWAAEPNKIDRISVTIFRIGQWSYRRKVLAPVHAIYRAADVIWLRTIVGAEVPASITCGPGFRMRHLGRGVIIHSRAILGSQVCLYHRVTIGQSKEGKGEKVPTLGSRIRVGAGAVILGDVTVHGNMEVPTVIGANAAVVNDVEAGTTVAGVPARVIGGNSQVAFKQVL